jgi:hypothetical protein
MNAIIFIIILWILIGLFNVWQRKMKAQKAKSRSATATPPKKKESEWKKLLKEQFDIEIREAPQPRKLEETFQEENAEPYVTVEEIQDEWDAEFDESPKTDLYEEEISPPAAEESKPEIQEPVKISPKVGVRKVKKYFPRTKSDLQKAIIFKEIIDPPISKRGKRVPYFLQ